jgi:ferritin-like metal-binding protein YciE
MAEGHMATIDSLSQVLVNELRDLYDAEKRLTTAIPKMSKKATNPTLRTTLDDHLIETKDQVRRLEKALRRLGETPRGKACVGMRGIVEEGNEHTSEDFERDDLRDVMIIGSAMRVEHYEMAAYMGAISHARMLGQTEVVDLLEETLAEEMAADKKLRAIGESAIDMDAPADGQADAQGSGLAGIMRTLTGNGSAKSNGHARKTNGRAAKRTGRRRASRARR